MKILTAFFLVFMIMPLFSESQEILSVCDRSPEIKKAIMKKIAKIDDTIDCSLAGDLLWSFNYLNIIGIEAFGLKFSRISEIKKGDFSGFSSLKKLYLSKNDITHLPAGVFNGLYSLQVLDLESNELTSIDIKAFEGLPNLEVIDLEGNELTSFPPGFFLGIRDLQFLDLDDNPISKTEQNRIKSEVYSEHKYWPPGIDENYYNPRRRIADAVEIQF